jgi:hypothetical protein
MFQSMLASLLAALQPYLNAMKPIALQLAEAELDVVIAQLQQLQASLKSQAGSVVKPVTNKFDH